MTDKQYVLQESIAANGHVGEVLQKRRKSSLNGGYAIFLVPGILIFLLLVVAPFIINIYVSFTKWSGVGEPTWVGLANYTKAFSDKNFWASFTNNLWLILGMTIPPTAIGLGLAVVLYEYIGKRFGSLTASIFRAGFYLPQIIPVVVTAVVWKWILQPDWGVLNNTLNSFGLGAFANNWLGNPNTALGSIIVMLIWIQIGYPLVIFMAGLQRIDPELYEAAEIDGATWRQKFLHITTPLLRPELYVVILTTTIHALKTFGPIYTMTRGGPGSSTIVASYFAYKNFFETSNVGYGAAIATLLTVIIVVISIVYIRIQATQEKRENL